MTNVFGAKFLKTLSPVIIPLPEEGTGEEEEDKEEEGGEDQPGGSKSSDGQEAKDSERKIWGMVSRAGEGVGRADNDRQFLYLNGRPVDLPKVLRITNFACSKTPRSWHFSRVVRFFLCTAEAFPYLTDPAEIGTLRFFVWT